MKYKVWKRELVNPVCVKRIQKESVGGRDKARKLAASVAKYLNSKRVPFAMVKHAADIKFFIASSLLENC